MERGNLAGLLKEILRWQLSFVQKRDVSEKSIMKELSVPCTGRSDLHVFRGHQGRKIESHCRMTYNNDS
jgi:hypothetical protein